VRQKVHAPAYATFAGDSNSGAMLDLNEILDISEVGLAVQSASPMKVDQHVELCLDLAEASGQISTTAQVVWSDSTGRVGLALPALPNSALHRLREWLFLNAMAGAANAAASPQPQPAAEEHAALRPTYTDTLNAASAVQREAESLGSDLEAVLSLVASRSQSLLRASGAAIALAESANDANVMICRASAGQSAPPVGAGLQVGSGFSGECVRTGEMSLCDDTETDERVDRQTCRALGIRSMLAAPLRSGEKIIGLLEVFSAQPDAFHENAIAILQRFAEAIVAAFNRAAKTTDNSALPPAPSTPFTPSPGSVLFAHEPEANVEKKSLSGDEDKVGGIRLPRVHLYLLICAAATIALTLGFLLAPWIQEKIQARDRSAEHTVLASSQPPPTATPAVETATLAELQQLAQNGDPAAENALGLRYASGDGVRQDDSEAARWFTKAAENGNVKAQVALSTRYWAGRGVPASLTQAYFWTVLARASGDKNSKTFAEFLASHMTRPQAAAIEQQANIWYQEHAMRGKPSPAR
jgi:putative methionine-R-sulfoxide reductase with GAF domain